VPCDAFHDELEIEPAADGVEEFILEGGSWNPREDLTFRAYLMLKEEFGIPAAKIRLRKGSPVGAGLGGGSADAAYAMKALSGMFDLGLTDADLASRVSVLGADCAFFIYDRPMLGEGKGEILSPYDIDLSGYEIRVEIPLGCAVSTREAYSTVLTREVHPDPQTSAPAYGHRAEEYCELSSCCPRKQYSDYSGPYPLYLYFNYLRLNNPNTAAPEPDMEAYTAPLS